ncbi:RepB family plasmid replication initiator protein [Cetobacterium sp.]|uniref:RepB family plasmid replication initiator protein n=1 Tax=Cetobacterium sp. TaxID=2071632 RepID=UPI003EE5249F
MEKNLHKPNELITISAKPQEIVLSETNDNLTVKISGAPLSKFEVLTYNFILLKLQKEQTDRLIISAEEIFKETNLANNYNDLYKYLDSLQKIRVESKDARGKNWGAFNLLSEFRKMEEGVFVAVPPSIHKALLTTNEQDKALYYTTINLLEESLFKNSHAIIFYEIFKKFDDVNVPIYTVDELRELTGTTEKYKEYKYFKRDVLEKALKEINDFFLGVKYTYEEELIGKRVYKIKFYKNKVEKMIHYSVFGRKICEIDDKMALKIDDAKRGIYFKQAYNEHDLMKLIGKYDKRDVVSALKIAKDWNYEIKYFKAFMKSKIEECKILRESKEAKTKENQGYILGQEEVEIPLKIDIIEPKKSDLDIEKEKVSNLIRNSDLPTNKRMNLWSKLAEIQNLEDLEKFKIEKLK